MSNTKERIKELLAHTNETLVSNWVQLASLIKNYENLDWKSSKKQALELLQQGNALDYVDVVRNEYSEKRPAKPKTQKSSKSKKAKGKVVPLNSKRDRFSMNYKYLIQLIPDLIDRLENGEEVYGKSQITGYMDFNIELVHKDSTGYYLAISHYYTQNGDLVPDPDMQILVSTEMQTVQALEFQNSMYYRKVYDDTYNRKLVNVQEKKSQNAFLNQWLRNLIKQGHAVVWRHLEDKKDAIPQEQTKQEQKLHPAFNRPDISYMDESVIKEIKQSIYKKKPEQLAIDYISFTKGTLGIMPIDFYFLVERMNEIRGGFHLPYPDDDELKEHYELLLKEKAKKEGTPTKETSDSIFESNFKKLAKVAPGLSIKISGIRLNPKNGRVFRSKSKKKGLLYDLHAKLTYGNDYHASLFLIEKESKNGEVHTAMRLHVDSQSREVHALSTRSDDGKPIYVYSNEKSFESANKKELKEQNEFLGKWLDELIRKGHKVKGWKKDEMKSEVIDEYHQKDSKPKKSANNEQDKTAKYWTKLAAFIEKTEGLDKKAAKKKAIALKKAKKAEEYVAQNFNRQLKVSKNQLLKTNYQKLLRLFPDLMSLDSGVLNRYTPKSGDSYLDIVPMEKEGQFGKQFNLIEYGKQYVNWMVTVQNVVKKVSVNSNILNEKKTKSDELDQSFGKWLDAKMSVGYSLIEKPLEELLKEYPIVLEWAEGTSGDENVGFTSLESLHDRLKTYEVPSKAKGYTKVKVWFRDYPNSVRIDLSKSKGDFDPNNPASSLLDWLDDYDSNFYWLKFSSAKDKPKKENTDRLKKQSARDRKPYPIVIEKDEIGSLEPVHMNTLRQLKGWMRSYAKDQGIDENGGTRELTIRFKDRSEPISITLSSVQNHFDPYSEAPLENWLNTNYPDFDWSAFSGVKDKSKNGPVDVLKKYPIAMQWSAAKNKDETTGFHSLEDLQDRFKKFVLPPNDTVYTTAKVWFRDYKTPVSIDLSETQGDFDPNSKKYDLEDWLENFDHHFDWFKFSKETDKKKLQKKADKVPAMEVGKVKLTKEHKRAGLTQKHINWINKHKQGIVITPIKRMTNNTKSFEKDERYQAKRAGKRVSKTGRIYYETRSNRSDMTDAGL